MTAASPRVAPSGVTVDVLQRIAAVGGRTRRRSRGARRHLAGGRRYRPNCARRGGRGAPVRRCDDRALSTPSGADAKNPPTCCRSRRRRSAGASVSESGAVHLGDIAIACETVVREAREQGRTVSAAPRASRRSWFSASLGIRSSNRQRCRADGRARTRNPRRPGHIRPLCPAMMLETGCDVRQFCPHDR